MVRTKLQIIRELTKHLRLEGVNYLLYSGVITIGQTVVTVRDGYVEVKLLVPGCSPRYTYLVHFVSAKLWYIKYQRFMFRTGLVNPQTKTSNNAKTINHSTGQAVQFGLPDESLRKQTPERLHKSLRATL
jgi:hypothetical protein